MAAARPRGPGRGGGEGALAPVPLESEHVRPGARAAGGSSARGSGTRRGEARGAAGWVAAGREPL